MINSSIDNNKPVYNDIFIRIIFSLFAAHFIIVYGDSADISTIIRHFNYYNALVASFIIAFLVLYYLWLITRYLDKKLDWFQKTKSRILAQLLLGFFPPALIAAGLAAIYFRMYGYTISETGYFSADFPVILLFIFMANLYYFIYYIVFHFWPAKHPKQHTEPARIVVVNEPEIAVADEPVLRVVEPTEKEWREIYIVNTATKSIPVKATDIAYFYRTNGCNFLRTFVGDDYPISEGLKDIEAQFSSEIFFRINRQVIVNIEACSFFSNGDREGTVVIDLSPPLIVDKEAKNKAVATVSEDRIKSFKAWLSR
ncbi:LytTR family DNA-binding domain-containing protein [Sphingobacterium detergens]|uniref:LytTr DNA-binding domain-containing protein n=1 Tax=Sphingobacterium detergens TaxID=1145106 RepID=A0A420ARV1_SPHD1|nr:LytTR family DNA-binding domain-containing protein [Sphingobacterium detergens]RKE47155.1 LytTr DNA-binding domain-containing protein [Sphingobacterium detergens]